MSEQGPPPQGDPRARARPRRSCARYAEQLKQVRVEDVIAQTIGPLLNLGTLRAGLMPGSEGEVDLDQLRKAIEAARALLPLVEPELGPEAAAVRGAVSNLQMAYAQLVNQTGAPPEAAEGEAPPTARAPARPVRPRRARPHPARRRRRTTSSPASPAPRSAPGASGCPASSRADTAAGTCARPGRGAPGRRSNANGRSVRCARYHHRRS